MSTSTKTKIGKAFYQEYTAGVIKTENIQKVIRAMERD